MPAVSERQRRFMGAELARKRAGKRTKTGMSESQLSDFAHMAKGAPPCTMPGCGKKHPKGEHRG